MLAESLPGFAAAHADIVTLGAEHEFVRRRHPKAGKVVLISGDGSGHEPLHAGFVGHGVLDAACPGHIFTSPTPNQMLAAAESVDIGAGVMFIATTGGRAVVGTLIVEKIVGAAAERDATLAELKTPGDAVNKATASMGVALTSCTVPAVGKPTFQLGADEMEMGVGIHGEPGRRRVKLTTADEIAAELTAAILKDLAMPHGQEVILLVNGFGATPTLELYVMVNAALKVLQGAGVTVVRHLTGSHVTSFEMAGFRFP